jgi:hypothetical protein
MGEYAEVSSIVTTERISSALKNPELDPGQLISPTSNLFSSSKRASQSSRT